MDNEYTELIVPFTIIFLVTLTLLYFAIQWWLKCWRNNRMAMEMPAWPTTEALARNWIVSRGSFRRTSNYTLVVTYHYWVNGKEYSIDVDESVFTFDRDAENDREQAKAKEDAESSGKDVLEEGKGIQVYYNPDDPLESTSGILQKHTCIPIVIVVLVLTMFCLISLLILIFSLVGGVAGFFGF